MVAACACVSRWNVGSSEGAAAKGGSKEPKVPWRVRAEPAGRLSLHATATAFGRRGLRAGGRRLTAGFAFLVLAKSELTALRRDGRGLRLRLVKKRRSSKEAAAEGESKEPKVPAAPRLNSLN